jgi:guanylate kinase
MRRHEVHGRPFFLSPEEFSFKQGDFEWARTKIVMGPQGHWKRRSGKGKVLLDLDTQGALQLKKINPEAVLIFLKPPSLGALEQRLRSRGTESEEVIHKRIARASQELAESDQYDFVVVNEDLEQAKKALKSVIQGILEGRPAPH